MLWVMAVTCLLATGLVSAVAHPGPEGVLDHLLDEPNHEVWAIDQSDTTADGGGTLYIYGGDQLAGKDLGAATPEVIDLGGAARNLCLAQTGTAPRRPHMASFDPRNTHAIIAFVTTGHVLFLDATTRAPVGCIDVGVQAHAVTPTPDGTSVIVANQNGKRLQRITTDYATNTFVLDEASTLDLATCTTPNGVMCQDPVLRPDAAPITAVIDSTGRFAFVTLRGGGLFVVETTSSPLRIVAEYDRSTIHPDGAPVSSEARGKIYINAGGGSAADPVGSDLYSLPLSGFSTTPNPPNTPLPRLVFSRDHLGFVDSHTLIVTRGEDHVWVADRAANVMVVVDTTTDQVVHEFPLAGAASSDPAPDILAISPSGNRVYAALRGPRPLTGNIPALGNAVGSTPGVGVIRVHTNGADGEMFAVAPITHVVAGVERADPHSVGVRPLPSAGGLLGLLQEAPVTP